MGKLPPSFCHVLFPRLKCPTVSFHIYSIPVSKEQITSLYQVIEIFFLPPFSSILSFHPSFFPSFLWLFRPFLGHGLHRFLPPIILMSSCFASLSSTEVQNQVFYRVGMLTLQPTPNLEDQDFILDLLSSGNSKSVFSCWGLSGLGDPAATYTTKCTAPSFLQACNHPHPVSWDIRFLILCSFVQLATEHIITKWSYSMSVW